MTDIQKTVDALRDAFIDMSEWVSDNPTHSEPELVSKLVQTQLFEDLGYATIGEDYRVDKTRDESSDRPDVRAINKETGEITFIIEAKRAGRDEALSTHTGQLSRYVYPLQAGHGLLFNGKRIILYELAGPRTLEEVFRSKTGELTDDQLEELATRLSRDARNLDQYDDLEDFTNHYDTEDNRIPLTTPESRANFYDDFALQEESSFRTLVLEIADLLNESMERSDFTESAYDFWRRSYARDTDTDSAPDWWEDLIAGTDFGWHQQGIQRFMFSLETAYALFSRLVLAKASSDYDLPNVEYGNTFLGHLHPLARNGEIPEAAWTTATRTLVDRMRQELIEGIFEEDIFYWWTDHLEVFETDSSRFWRESGQVGNLVDELSPVGEALRGVLLSLHKYEFGNLATEAGDPLGNLYQNYFDAETRKALGEFYTPKPVVNHMLDTADYHGAGVRDSQLIDPACGSGTFIVSALERYLRGMEDRADRDGWTPIIEELCNEFKIVGFDIHPFAVLMSQVQFMLVLLPRYKQAREEPGDVNAMRLPIFRTNSLEGIGQTQIGGGSNTMTVETKLPVKDDDGNMIDMTFQFPKYATIISENNDLDIYGVEEYFMTLQALFDVVKEQANLAEAGLGDYEITLDQIEESFVTNLGDDRDTRRLAQFFKTEIGDDLIDDIETLVNKYDDGRLIKSIEDNVLSTLLKNPSYVSFEYIVANPPYVDNQGVAGSTGQTEIIESQNYRTTDGNWDLYLPFMEKGIQWLAEDGSFVYITPDQYMRTDYGAPLRDIIRQDTSINQIVDFRDTQVFEDALNYTCITALDAISDDEDPTPNTFRFARVSDTPDDDDVLDARDDTPTDTDSDSDSGDDTPVPGETDADTDDDEDEDVEITEREAVSYLLDTIAGHIDDEYRDDCVETFGYEQGDLTRDIWPIMPSDEQAVFEAMEENATTRIRDVTTESGSFEGVRTGLNDVFVVDPVHRSIVPADDNDGTVEVRPSGNGDEFDGTYDVDAALLRPFLRGGDVGRWRIKSWTGRHIIRPYTVPEGIAGRRAQLIGPDTMEDKYTATLDYLNEFRDQLEARDNGEYEDTAEWYQWSRTQNIVEFAEPKILNVEVSAYPQFYVDELGEWYATSAYGMQIDDQYDTDTPLITALLNSRILDYYLKHVSVLKEGRHYKYSTAYLERVPVIIPDHDTAPDATEEIVADIEDVVDRIDVRMELETRVSDFPGTYISEYRSDGNPVDRKTVTCRAGHSDMDPEIKEVDENTFHIIIGARKTEDPIMVNSEAKAKYVYEALAGDSVSKDEDVSVLVPKSSSSATALIEDWKADKEALAEKDSITELQAEIDALVFDLFFGDHHYDTANDSEDADSDADDSEEAPTADKVITREEAETVINRFHSRYSVPYWDPDADASAD